MRGEQSVLRAPTGSRCSRPSTPPRRARISTGTRDGGAEPVDASDGGAVMPFRRLAAVTWSAGALAGDVPALARWAHELLGGHVLKPASLQEMTRFHNGQILAGLRARAWPPTPGPDSSCGATRATASAATRSSGTPRART